MLALPNVTTGLIAMTLGSGPWVTEHHGRIRKRMDTAVTFTSEYSKGYRIQRNVSTIFKAQAQPRTPHYGRGKGLRGLFKIKVRSN